MELSKQHAFREVMERRNRERGPRVKAWMDEARAELLKHRVYQVRVELQKQGLDRASVIEALGEDAAEKLRKSLGPGGFRKEGGRDVNMAAAEGEGNDNNITGYKSRHAASSSGVSQPDEAPDTYAARKHSSAVMSPENNSRSSRSFLYSLSRKRNFACFLGAIFFCSVMRQRDSRSVTHVPVIPTNASISSSFAPESSLSASAPRIFLKTTGTPYSPDLISVSMLSLNISEKLRCGKLKVAARGGRQWERREVAEGEEVIITHVYSDVSA